MRGPRWVSSLLIVAACAATPSTAQPSGDGCGEDPGPPRPVSLETCDRETLSDQVSHLFAVYAHASCTLSEAEEARPDLARTVATAVTLLDDPKLDAHLEACAEAASASDAKEAGSAGGR
jgi:hypothetical protein